MPEKTNKVTINKKLVPIDNFGMSTKTTEQSLKNCFGGSKKKP